MDAVALSAVDLRASSPLLILSSGILLFMLADAFLKRIPHVALSAGILLLSALPTLALIGEFEAGATAYHGFLYVDDLSQVVSLILLGGSLLTLMLSVRISENEQVEKPGDFYTLFLLSVLGALVFANSAELITIFLGLELMSMPLYCLCGAALGRATSSESALKYFFLGSFASGFMLFGIALLFGLGGTTFLPTLGSVLPMEESLLIFFAFAFFLIGLGFKLAAVPFHFWAPDVYQGAPTPVTAFMATVVKASAVVVTLRILWTVFGSTESLTQIWTGGVWIVSLLTMIVGNVLAIQQRSMKRLFAYSSIAHVGYLLMGILVPDALFTSAAILFYLITYTVMTVGVFGVVVLVCGRTVSQPGGDDITRFNHLGHRRPVLAAVMSLFLFALAGLPPGMAGLFGKFYLFNSAVRGDYIGLAVIGVLASAVSCYYYLRIIVAMYFVPASEAATGDSEKGVALSGSEWPVRLVVGFCAAAVLGLGFFPGLIFDKLKLLGAGFFA